MGIFGTDGGAAEAQSEAAGLAKHWRTGDRARVLASFRTAVADRLFVAAVMLYLADTLDAGERADLISMMEVRGGNTMARYQVQFIHKISSRRDWQLDAELPDGSFADRRALGKALRDAKMLCKGESVAHFRVEHDGKVVAFPRASIWHSLILTRAP